MVQASGDQLPTVQGEPRAATGSTGPGQCVHTGSPVDMAGRGKAGVQDIVLLKEHPARFTLTVQAAKTSTEVTGG